MQGIKDLVCFCQIVLVPPLPVTYHCSCCLPCPPQNGTQKSNSDLIAVLNAAEVPGEDIVGAWARASCTACRLLSSPTTPPPTGVLLHSIISSGCRCGGLARLCSHPPGDQHPAQGLWGGRAELLGEGRRRIHWRDQASLLPGTSPSSMHVLV